MKNADFRAQTGAPASPTTEVCAFITSLTSGTVITSDFLFFIQKHENSTQYSTKNQIRILSGDNQK